MPRVVAGDSGGNCPSRSRRLEATERRQLAKAKHLTDSRFPCRQTFELACFLAGSRVKCLPKESFTDGNCRLLLGEDTG
jgi:hypothetical protein